MSILEFSLEQKGGEMIANMCPLPLMSKGERSHVKNLKVSSCW